MCFSAKSFTSLPAFFLRRPACTTATFPDH
jgi:hypothetical protein